MKMPYLKSCFFISFFSLSACAQTSTWVGTYTYEAFLGENSAEDKVLIEYVLTINKNECVITSQGYQTDEKIMCETEEENNNLIVKFISYGDGSTKNIYGVEEYPPKSTLFTLTHKKPNLITTWGLLAPDDTFSTGEHFKRSSSIQPEH